MFSSKINIHFAKWMNCQDKNVGCYDLFTLCLFFAFLLFSYLQIAQIAQIAPPAYIPSCCLGVVCIFAFSPKGILKMQCKQKGIPPKIRWRGYRYKWWLKSSFKMFSKDEDRYVPPCLSL